MTREPTDDRRKRNQSAAIIAALMIVLSGVYIAAYLAFNIGGESPNHRMRVYNSGLMARCFVPAAWIESRLIGKKVWLWGLGVNRIPGVTRKTADLDFTYMANP